LIDKRISLLLVRHGQQTARLNRKLFTEIFYQSLVLGSGMSFYTSYYRSS